jgi:hypothetical protein
MIEEGQFNALVSPSDTAQPVLAADSDGVIPLFAPADDDVVVISSSDKSSS